MVTRETYVVDSITESLIAYRAVYDAGWIFVDSFFFAPFLVHLHEVFFALTRDDAGHL